MSGSGKGGIVLGKINVLEKQVAELIAAGEVVERPASIVKELVENAIDAGASAVTVEIRGGGIRYIRVTDNGCGIEREDVSKAFLRHATSKVRDSGDLNHIMTMGFRGEALASIAAMSRVELLTRTAGELAGTRYAVSGGEEEALEDAGCPVGTTITIRDVFYNTPARMKFLKKDVTEGNSVQAVVEKAALAEPSISFRFIRDRATRLQTPGDGKILSAARVVFGKEFTDSALSVCYTHEGLSLEGLICKPEIARASRTLQNFFINRRFVRSKTCMAALEEAYKGALMVGKFPSCALNLTIPPQTVDVNVHPAKTEVRFANEKNIFSLVYYGCKTALGAANLAPEIEVPEKRWNPFAAQQSPDTPRQQRMDAAEYRNFIATPPKPRTAPELSFAEAITKTAALSRAYPMRMLDIETDEEPPLKDDTIMLRSAPFVYEAVPDPLPEPKRHEAFPSTEQAPEKQAPPIPNPEFPDEMRLDKCEVKNLYTDVRVVGEVFSTYILLEGDGELMIVDKHAAHERLLYNRLIGQGAGDDRQLLLSPVTVRLSAEEYSAVLENLPLLEQAGIPAEDFGNGCVLVREAAPVLSDADLGAIVTEFAQKLIHGSDHLVSRRMEELFHTVACRAAVKAGDRTETPSLEQLVALLREDSDTAHCPHGRPVAVRMTRHALEKKFGRLG